MRNGLMQRVHTGLTADPPASSIDTRVDPCFRDAITLVQA
jgi:hypothetical protein